MGSPPRALRRGNSCQGERPPVPTGLAPVADGPWDARSPCSSLASTEKRQGGGAWGHNWGWFQDLPFNLLSCSCDHPPRTTDAPARHLREHRITINLQSHGPGRGGTGLGEQHTLVLRDKRMQVQATLKCPHKQTKIQTGSYSIPWPKVLPG